MRKKIKKIFILVFGIILILQSGTNISSRNHEEKERASDTGRETVVITEKQTVPKETQAEIKPAPEPMEETLEIHFLDVGQADCALLLYGNYSVLIDAGNNSDGTAIQNYLQKQSVEKLDYLILSHPHADHIGGADVIITKFDVDHILMPDCAADTATYRDVVDAMEYKNYVAEHPETGDTFTMDELSFQVLNSGNNGSDDLNNNSLVVRFTYGDNSFLFMGDAEEEEEIDILNAGYTLNSDVLKVGHHGSYTSSSSDFICEVSPEYAVISCGVDNDYGHPHSAALNTLRAAGSELFRTDEQGTVILTSDGKNITWNCEPCNDWQSGR